MDGRLLKAWRFFLEHAGYCEGRRAAGALQLARAERWAEESGVRVEWMDDPDGFAEWYDVGGYQPREILGCVLTLGDETASLWSIGDPSPAYRRVVEAELAAELRLPIFRELRSYIDMLG